VFHCFAHIAGWSLFLLGRHLGQREFVLGLRLILQLAVMIAKAAAAIGADGDDCENGGHTEGPERIVILMKPMDMTVVPRALGPIRQGRRDMSVVVVVGVRRTPLPLPHFLRALLPWHARRARVNVAVRAVARLFYMVRPLHSL
jgi:hypothetical protein